MYSPNISAMTPQFSRKASKGLTVRVIPEDFLTKTSFEVNDQPRLKLNDFRLASHFAFNAFHDNASVSQADLKRCVKHNQLGVLLQSALGLPSQSSFTDDRNEPRRCWLETDRLEDRQHTRNSEARNHEEGAVSLGPGARARCVS